MKEIARGIVVDAKVRFGKPVIKGTRVPVDLVVGKLAGGMTIEVVMKEYELKREDVLNALSYAAKLTSEEEVRVAE
ncbi:MAG: DUF433 domain-containing protein [Deltaproteobacteria bacterium]